MKIARLLLAVVGVPIVVGVALLFLAVRRSPERFGEAVTRVVPPVADALPAPARPTEASPLVRTAVAVPPGVAARAVAGRALEIPAGWRVSVFAAGFRKPRMLARAPDGTLYVTAMDEGRVYALADADADGVADGNVIVAEGLRRPSGIVWHDGALYVGEEDEVTRVRPSDGRTETVVASLPAGGNHVTRTLAIRDGTLYVSVGSSCNACEDDPDRAAVLAYALDGTGKRLFARGLRNAVGLIVGPDGELWATDNGRDLLGDDLPPEEVDVLREGKDYGWPYCYGERVPDPEFGSAPRCAGTDPPTVAFQAHSAPLGLRFLGEGWPAPYAGSLIVASHGSWNRTQPTGYKLLRMIETADGWQVSDFVTGWRPGSAEAWGRPVDVIEGGGGLFISDDKAGVIYLLRAPGA